MNSFQAKQKLDALMGRVDPKEPLPMASLVDWAEQVHHFVPAPDLHDMSFQVSFTDDTRVIAGCRVLFVQTFSGLPDRDNLTMLLERQDLPAADPIREYDCYVSLRDFPDAEAFFAAVRAHPSYQFACTYPFEEVRVYNHAAATMQVHPE